MYKTRLFIFISSSALLIVLFIQVRWIIETAKIKEDIFNDKANMVLSKTAAVLSSDTLTCKRMDECIGKDEIHKTDSLFTNYMKYYNFHIDYSFDVKQPEADSQSSLENNIYKKRLDEEVSKNGLELNLFLPKKKQFIVAEMGPMFITSVILIMIVLIMFWRTIILLMKEKKISEHTTDFLNNMTHEFKTPLANIALAGKMILKDSNVQQEEKIRHYSAIILEENERLRLQVEQVLSMTALERGEIPIQREILSFHQVINDTVRSVNLQLENRHGQMHLFFNATNDQVYGDKVHLQNSMRNLIENAIKYSAVEPDISIKTFNQDKNLYITVSDKGIGIEKEYHKSVFTKYFRVPTGDVHDVKGFGLGLAYFKKIIELHNGNIELMSQPGEGSTFTIVLPNA